MLGKIEGRRRRGHQRVFGQTLGDSEGHRGLVCCSSRGRKESETTERPNNNKVMK